MEYIHIQLTKELKDKLKNEAKEKGLSLTAYIRLLLIDRKEK